MSTLHAAALRSLRDHLAAPPYLLSDDDPLLDALAPRAAVREARPGERLCAEGDRAERLWWIVSGEVAVSVRSDAGEPVSVGIVGAGSLVGEAALLRGPKARRSATLEARVATTLLEIPVETELRDAFTRSGLHPRLVRVGHARAVARGRARRSATEGVVSPPDPGVGPSGADPGADGWKTLLFLPQFAFEKAWQLSADAFVVDFQDAVPLAAKAAARGALRRALASGDLGDRPVVVRVNERAVPEELALDLDAVVGLAGVTALIPTMIEHPEELEALHRELGARERALGLPEGHTRLLPLVETPAAVLRIDAISRAGGGRLVGLLLGHGDLFRLTGARPHGESTLDFPRNAVVFAARAAGIAAFDTPFTGVADAIGLEREARASRRHGFDGKACVHPDQLATVARCMRHAPEEVAWARRVEQARRDGRLATLQRRLEAPDAPERADRETDGMALVDGQLVGPPHIKAAQRILRLEGPESPPERGRRGRVVSHRSDAAIAPGAEIGNPYELTVTDGMRDLWAQCFYSHDAAVTSRAFAAAIGRCDGAAMPTPFLMALYLCVSMSDTHGAIYHLGFRGARQLAPIQVGDTVRQRIRMLRLRNTTDGRRAVVTTERELLSVGTGEVLFRTEKLELYPAQRADFGEPPARVDVAPALPSADRLLAAVLAGVPAALAARAGALGLARPTAAFATGDVLLHSFARPMGVSANLALSTQFLVTHPIHLDHHRFDQGDGVGVVVSGGLVIAMACAAAARDIGHVVWEELLLANNVRTVSPGETVGAFSVILDRAELPGHPDLEVLVVKTVGTKDVTPAAELDGVVLPEALLAAEVGGGGRYDALCRAAGLDILEGRIVAEVLRRLVRVRPRPTAA